MTAEDHLNALLEEVEEYAKNADWNSTTGSPTPDEIAMDIVSTNTHLFSNNSAVAAEDPDNLEILRCLRDRGYLCTSELLLYKEGVPSYDPHTTTIEVIIKRSLEEFFHKHLSSQTEEQHATN